jgi:hypothetical protein
LLSPPWQFPGMPSKRREVLDVASRHRRELNESLAEIIKLILEILKRIIS